MEMVTPLTYRLHSNTSLLFKIQVSKRMMELHFSPEAPKLYIS